MAPQKTEKVSVSLPIDVIKAMDDEIAKGTYATRSHCAKFALMKLFNSSKGKIDHY